MEDTARPNMLQLVGGYLRSFIAYSVKGPFYLYMLSLTLFFIVGVLGLFISSGGIGLLTFVLQMLKPLFIALGFPENGIFSCKSCITPEVLGYFALVCSIAGWTGSKIIERWKGRKPELLGELVLVAKLTIAANLLLTAEFFFFSLQKNPGLQGAFFSALAALAVSSIFAVIALTCYALGRAIEEVKIEGVRLNSRLTHENYVKFQKNFEEYEKKKQGKE